LKRGQKNEPLSNFSSQKRVEGCERWGSFERARPRKRRSAGDGGVGIVAKQGQGGELGGEGGRYKGVDGGGRDGVAEGKGRDGQRSWEQTGVGYGGEAGGGTGGGGGRH